MYARNFSDSNGFKFEWVFNERQSWEMARLQQTQEKNVGRNKVEQKWKCQRFAPDYHVPEHAFLNQS